MASQSPFCLRIKLKEIFQKKKKNEDKVRQKIVVSSKDQNTDDTIIFFLSAQCNTLFFSFHDHDSLT